MNKETLITLIEKDINELQALTKGFSELTSFPQPLLDLALAKVANLQHCLTELPETLAVAPAEQPKVESEPEIEIEIVVEEENEPEIEPQEEISEEIVEESVEESAAEPEIVEEIVPNESEGEPIIVAETIQKTDAVVDMFEKEQERASVASTIANQPIEDIKRAISIADRFRFQRELFANNGELMAKTLDALNACATYSDAERYLDKHCKLPQENQATADFMELIKRRFL